MTNVAYPAEWYSDAGKDSYELWRRQLTADADAADALAVAEHDAAMEAGFGGR